MKYHHSSTDIAPLSQSLLKSLLITFFFTLSAFPSPSHCEDDEQFTTCSRRLYSCGSLQNLSYPFSGGHTRPSTCGHPGFELQCHNNNYSTIKINELEFRVLNVSQENNTMTLARSDLWDNLCPPKSNDTTLNHDLFLGYAPTVENLTLIYSCQDEHSLEPFLSLPLPNHFSCGDGRLSFYINDSILNMFRSQIEEHCYGGIVKVPVFKTVLDELLSSAEGRSIEELRDELREGFDVNYIPIDLCEACENSGGKCGNNGTRPFLCFCRDGPELFTCPTPGTRARKIKTFLGLFVGAISVLLACILMYCYRKACPLRFLLKRTKKDQDIEAFIRSNGQLAVKRYRFSDVKKMTKSFEDKLGQGGYGEVYRGKLPDGRLVAVKLLKSSKGNGEEFVNEVASIIRTSHVNIVTLVGFCLEGSKRALIYEFMPNGSLEKFVYNENASHTNPNLEWEKLLQIATGIARGLEYLHRGCNTKILHLDIKPHNILLDEDFCPKISDFGLSKLCPKKESIVSLMEARGTIGYVAPEVFNRNFGGVSSMSDVYSYGMMILEMVGGRKNIKVDVSHTSEIYFPDWIYKHLELGDNLQLWSGMTSEENGMARKMIIVGLWCIQTNPSDRPSMSKVIEMLEGNLDALNIPPKPTFSSPRSPEQFPAELATESSTSSLL